MGDVAIVDLVTHRITEDNEKGEPILSATLSGESTSDAATGRHRVRFKAP